MTRKQWSDGLHDVEAVRSAFQSLQAEIDALTIRIATLELTNNENKQQPCKGRLPQ